MIAAALRRVNGGPRTVDVECGNGDGRQVHWLDSLYPVPPIGVDCHISLHLAVAEIKTRFGSMPTTEVHGPLPSTTPASWASTRTPTANPS